MRSRNWLTFLIATILTIIFSWGIPVQPLLAARPSLATSQPACDIDFTRNQQSNFETNLKIIVSSGCLEDIFNASQILEDAKKRIENETDNRLDISNLQYALDNPGVTVTGDIVFQAPLAGSIPLNFSQNIVVGTSNGKLLLEVGETQVTSTQNIPKNLVVQFLQRQVQNQIQRWNGQPIDQLFVDNDSQKIARKIGINRDDLDFILQLLQENVVLEIGKANIVVDIPLPETATFQSDKLKQE